MENLQQNLTEIIENYGEKIFNIAYRILGNVEDAEDVVQETFISVYENFEKFRGESTLYSWIYRIAVNHSLAHKKRDNRVILKSFDDSTDRDAKEIPGYLLSDLDEPEKKVFLEELSYEIKQKCQFFMTFRLTEEQRIVFLLRYMLDLSYKEISFVLDVSEDVVKTRLSRAHSNLKKNLQNKCSWIDPDNPCKCKDKLGFVLSKYPQIINDIRRKRKLNPDYKKIMAESVSKRFKKIEDLYKEMPLLEYKIKPLENYLKK